MRTCQAEKAMLSLYYRESLKHIILKEDLTMSEALKNVAAFSGSACGAADPGDKPASACGSACGAADPKEDKPASACGSACGAADPDKK